MTTPTRPTNPYGMSRDTRTACPATLQCWRASLAAHRSPHTGIVARTVGRECRTASLGALAGLAVINASRVKFRVRSGW